jgi:hypothetical protein
MTSRDFAFWLQGFFELAGDDAASLVPEQVHLIKQHLSLVFVHEIDPSQGGPEHQAKLNAIHNAPPAAPTSLQEINAYNEKAKQNGQPLMRC